MFGLHQVELSRKPFLDFKAPDESVQNIGSDNVIVKSLPSDELGKFRVSDFERKSLIEAGVPLKDTFVDMPNSMAENELNNGIESINKKLTENG